MGLLGDSIGLLIGSVAGGPRDGVSRIRKARAATTGRRAGFTLLELLAVVSILAVLLGLVLSAVHSVQDHTRRALARAEVRSVESALKTYLEHYGTWKRLLDNLPEEDRFQKGAVECFAIGPSVALALEGDAYALGSDEVAERINPDAIPFLEFSRHYRAKTGKKERFPVNPWTGKGEQSGSSLGEADDARYFVAIDANANGCISLPSGGRFPKNDNDRISRAVVVWTYNPRNTRDEAIVSWMEE